jgi:hypothetical protein
VYFVVARNPEARLAVGAKFWEGRQDPPVATTAMPLRANRGCEVQPPTSTEPPLNQQRRWTLVGWQ